MPDDKDEKVENSIDKLNANESASTKNLHSGQTSFYFSGDLMSVEKENEKIDKNAFLNLIYLAKSPYKINGKFVQSTEDVPSPPVCFLDAIKDFETG